jgi:hypothetical protein
VAEPRESQSLSTLITDLLITNGGDSRPQCSIPLILLDSGSSLLSLNSLYSLYSFPALDQRLINQVGETLEEAMLVVREMLGKDEQDELFNRINAA